MICPSIGEASVAPGLAPDLCPQQPVVVILSPPPPDPPVHQPLQDALPDPPPRPPGAVIGVPGNVKSCCCSLLLVLNLHHLLQSERQLHLLLQSDCRSP